MRGILFQKKLICTRIICVTVCYICMSWLNGCKCQGLHLSSILLIFRFLICWRKKYLMVHLVHMFFHENSEFPFLEGKPRLVATHIPMEEHCVHLFHMQILSLFPLNHVLSCSSLPLNAEIPWPMKNGCYVEVAKRILEDCAKDPIVFYLPLGLFLDFPRNIIFILGILVSSLMR